MHKLQSPDPDVAVPARVGRYRWVVCGLLFLAATINYIDRQVIGLLKPTLQQQYGWSEIDYADIVFSFQLAYAIGLLLAGRLIDRIGTRIGFALFVLLWSIAAMAHAEAARYGPAVAVLLGVFGLAYTPSVAGFIAARFALGIGEAGNFPAAIKSVAEWFPVRERAFATGIFNSGTNIGAVLAPLAVPWITATYGWYWAFVATGAIGFLWIVLWLPLFGQPASHPRVGAEELAHIQSDPAPAVARVPLRAILPHRQTWAFAIGKFMTDPIWWLYLFWVPDFLSRNYGLNLLAVGPPLVAIYLISDVGSIGGGWLSSMLIKRGWTVNRARKTAMLVSALSVVPIVFAAQVSSLWVAVLLVALAAAAHQGWSANMFTLASDMFPRHAVGTVVGFGGMAGAVGGMLIAKLTGYILETTGSYLPVFLIAGTTYMLALVVIHVLAPRLDKASL
jgi:MFS transporter, ACS family, hexuronate transporter